MKMGIGTRRGGIIGAAVAATAASLALAPSAFGIGFAPTTATTPATTQAGANTDFTIKIDFSSAGDQVKNLTVGLPPGQIGDPNATPTCTVAQLNGNACPANTAVGSVSAAVTVLGVVPLTVNGSLYNLVPQTGEPARFGIVLNSLPVSLPGLGSVIFPPTILQSAVQLRQSDFGLNTVITDIPNTATVLPGVDVPIDITSQTITLFGTAPGTGKPFSRNPTSCDPAVTTFSATSYSGSTTVTPATGTAQYTPTGCQNVPFSPEFSARIGAPGFTGPGTKPPMTTSIRQTPDEAGLKDAIVFLPSILGADLVALETSCPPAQFQAGTCPDNTVIGSAIAETPLLTSPLAGPVIVVTGSNPGDLPKLGLDLRGALPLKLSGLFVLEGGTGVAFNDLPDIPISNFELRFKENGLSTTSVNLCNPPTPAFSTDFTAYSGAKQVQQNPATVEGCTPPRAPTAKVKVKGLGSAKPSLKLKAAAGSSKLQVIKVKLPKSLRFGSPDAVDRGLKAKADGRKLGEGFVSNGNRKFKVTLPSGANNVVVQFGKGALKSRGAAKKKLKFPVRIVDVDGGARSLNLKVRAKAKKR